MIRLAELTDIDRFFLRLILSCFIIIAAMIAAEGFNAVFYAILAILFPAMIAVKFLHLLVY